MVAPYTIRWKLTDLDTDEFVILPLNPNEMSTPTQGREITYGWTPGGRMAGIDRGASVPTSWTWSGVILTQEHYDLLLEWSQRGSMLRVDDHLGRSFGIIIEKYEPIEKQRTQNREWHSHYTITCLLVLEEM